MVPVVFRAASEVEGVDAGRRHRRRVDDGLLRLPRRTADHRRGRGRDPTLPLALGLLVLLSLVMAALASLRMRTSPEPARCSSPSAGRVDLP